MRKFGLRPKLVPMFFQFPFLVAKQAKMSRFGTFSVFTGVRASFLALHSHKQTQDWNSTYFPTQYSGLPQPPSQPSHIPRLHHNPPHLSPTNPRPKNNTVVPLHIFYFKCNSVRHFTLKTSLLPILSL